MKEHPKHSGYFITEDGRVFSSWTKRIGLGHKKGTLWARGEELKELSYETIHNGYLRVVIKQSKYLVHRLVAETYLDNIDNKKEVNHKDKNRKNNLVSNLEWVTSQENVEHSHAKTWKVVNIITEEETSIFNLRKWCRENDIDVRQLHKASKTNKTYKGYKCILIE
tara:strand:+ start:191 stop:688 length:498 start_codon:yes stop_codon:yes gene_type:complete